MLKQPTRPPQRRRRFEHRLHPNGDGHQLEWMQVAPSRSRGTLFAPPLVGGDGLLTIRYLRPFRSRGYSLMSFNYSGHGRSSRPFSIRQSFRDTHCLLALARQRPEHFPRPLYGVGICYAAIPLLHTLHYTGEPLPQLVLINAIPRLFSRHLLHSFWDFRRRLQAENWSSGHLGAQLRRYTEFLLPGLTINRTQFGLLAMRRIRLLQTLMDWLASRQLRSVRLARTKVLCLYSREDRIFRAFRYFDHPRDYEAAIRKICPGAQFVRLAGDHFLSSPHERWQALRAMTNFFDAHDREATRRAAA
ncbi:MAG: hypothetical protein PVF55_08805 [Desulfobacterales bacterium]|jgi:hypothetical protein